MSRSAVMPLILVGICMVHEYRRGRGEGEEREERGRGEGEGRVREVKRRRNMERRSGDVP